MVSMRSQCLFSLAYVALVAGLVMVAALSQGMDLAGDAAGSATTCADSTVNSPDSDEATTGDSQVFRDGPQPKIQPANKHYSRESQWTIPVPLCPDDLTITPPLAVNEDTLPDGATRSS